MDEGKGKMKKEKLQNRRYSREKIETGSRVPGDGKRLVVRIARGETNTKSRVEKNRHGRCEKAQLTGRSRMGRAG